MSKCAAKTKPDGGASVSTAGLAVETQMLGWRVHTPNLLKEIARNNPSASILRIPIQIFGDLLFEVGERAAELNDPKLNALMARLTIYSVADMESPDYDEAVVRELLTANALGHRRCAHEQETE